MRPYLTITFLAFSMASLAQSHTLTQTTTPFVSVAGTADSLLPADWNSLNALIHLPAPFTYLGNPYDNMYIDPEGTIFFGLTDSAYFPQSNDTILAEVMPHGHYALWGGGPHSVSRANGSAIYYDVSGPSGNQVITVEWNNMGFAEDGPSKTRFITFMATLFEQTGVVEFHFGPQNTDISVYVNDVVFIGIGQRDTTMSAFYMNATFLQGSASNPNTKPEIDGVYTIPSSNTKYTFTPVVTGIDENPVADFSIHPNPVVDVLHLAREGDWRNTTVRIYDMTGKQVKIVSDAPKQINTNDLQPGIYLLEVMAGDQSYMQKFVKL